MASDLTIPQGTTLVLDEKPSANIATGFQKIQITTLKDLADAGIIASKDTINVLLKAAQDATAASLSQKETSASSVPAAGATSPDLKRFGSFLAAVPTIDPGEAQTFWRVARQIDPKELVTLTPVAKFQMNPIILLRYLFKDIVVGLNSTLEIAQSIKQLGCRNLLIKKNGRIVVKSSGLKLTAFSIKGEQ